ncbi:hypothetical protein TCAL_08601 [Tigriopus californicus]|uniref:Uncharacterized protein n=1 Tax=Tigriopus californicus TaxID=6832 RepID=A0A553PJZ9_TIGCA|nr:hypothetical protein TCAL_08601 [Tigriopus californicus]
MALALISYPTVRRSDSNEFEISRDRVFDSHEQRQDDLELVAPREQRFGSNSDSRCPSSCHYRHQDIDQVCTEDQSCRRGLVCSIANLCTTKGLGTQKQGAKCVHQTDCFEGLSCLKGRCDNFGREGDPCHSSKSCRGRRFKRQNSLVSQTVKFICQSVIIRADSNTPCASLIQCPCGEYCDRGDSNTPCASLIHCPCGEYCDRGGGKCRAAKCTEIGGECPAYGLPFNFRCHHGVCMLPQEDIQASISRVNKAAKAANRSPKGKGKGKLPKAKLIA